MSETFDTESLKDNYVMIRLQGPMWAMFVSGLLQSLFALAILGFGMLYIVMLGAISVVEISNAQSGDWAVVVGMLVVYGFTTAASTVLLVVTGLWMRGTYRALSAAPNWRQAQRVGMVGIGLGVAYGLLLMVSVFTSCSCFGLLFAPVLFLSSVGSSIWLLSTLQISEVQDTLRTDLDA